MNLKENLSYWIREIEFQIEADKVEGEGPSSGLFDIRIDSSNKRVSLLQMLRELSAKLNNEQVPAPVAIPAWPTIVPPTSPIPNVFPIYPPGLTID